MIRIRYELISNENYGVIFGVSVRKIMVKENDSRKKTKSNTM